MEQGQITKEEAEKHPNKNLITRALGPDDNVEVDYYEIPIFDGDKIVICTDGLSSYVSSEEIYQIAKYNNKKYIVNTLIKKAIENKSTDNITVVVVESKEDA